MNFTPSEIAAFTARNPTKPRAKRFTGPKSRAKAIARARLNPQPLRQSALVLSVSVDLPIRTVNSLNAREHWAVKAKRAKRERDLTRYSCSQRQPFPLLPWVVTLRRFSPGTRPMDGDGLQASMKHIRDEIAACAGVDDGNREQITFQYDQQRGERHMVRVVIATSTEAK